MPPENLLDSDKGFYPGESKMMIRLISLATVLIVGASIGWLLANHWGDSPDPGAKLTAGYMNPALTTAAAPFEHDPKIETEQKNPLSRTDNPVSVEKAPSLDRTLMGIQTRLERETAQRRLLERRVQELSDKLASLAPTANGSTGQPLATLASAAHGETPTDPDSQAKARRTRFQAVGFDLEEEIELTRRVDETAMERLYLRDRARREGWRRTPEYRQAARELRSELRNEVGDETYDRLLYAREQDNRVLIERVLESSPAQEIGLQPGDVIVGYDGARVFSRRDIRTARGSGEAGDPVPLRIERNGEVLELEIPRGPLGVHLDSTSVIP